MSTWLMPDHMELQVRSSRCSVVFIAQLSCQCFSVCENIWQLCWPDRQWYVNFAFYMKALGFTSKIQGFDVQLKQWVSYCLHNFCRVSWESLVLCSTPPELDIRAWFSWRHFRTEQAVKPGIVGRAAGLSSSPHGPCGDLGLLSPCCKQVPSS